MFDDPRLIFGTLGYGIGAIFSICLAFFVLFKAKQRPANIYYFLANISVAIFEISYIIGINTTDPYLSRTAFMFSTSVIFVAVFVAHWMTSLVHKTKELRIQLLTVDIVAAILFIIYLLYPDAYLLPSQAKMYFPNYYVPGTLHTVMRVIFNLIVPLYFTYQVYKAYRIETDSIVQNRYKYVFAGVAYGYVIGSIPVFLIYNIPVDPLWGMFISFYMLFFAYTMLKHELMDIRLVAKQATVYAVIVAILVSFLVLANLFNNELSSRYPGFPAVVAPMISSLIAFAIGVFVWRKFRESDMLKYEFVNIISHKFKTPLTRIRWAVEELEKSGLTEGQKKALEAVKNGNDSLTTLTNTLTGGQDPQNYSYRLKNRDFSQLVNLSLNHYTVDSKKKNLTLDTHLEKELWANVDQIKIQFVLHTLIENAIAYTSAGGNIRASLSHEGNRIIFKITDTGIGIVRAEHKYILSKFYRSHRAELVDTEGLGIGLFLSNSIVARHGGKITFTSEGEGKGTTFTMALPLTKPHITS
ncbi:MAG: hypothetical protein A3C06_04005 [Candidatus Taylorbacteria bacterium RIFCSPHIGHO2_02_FULL_46_13]|uniref:histidine kinase n=1 Tax=Candidatus Taylorbacteria bacterium RIFCSPHIGHO2_02_FULL_46_13 TaxID=1802312 RepID=A0A1G2MTM0_9BACT|nr:MAG: hypothetical protein A3C06_04005 [Candidatus Taylorbacteria bacterium RIFCSPHIGHO2_02_FULL_46_13]